MILHGIPDITGIKQLGLNLSMLIGTEDDSIVSSCEIDPLQIDLSFVKDQSLVS